MRLLQIEVLIHTTPKAVPLLSMANLKESTNETSGSYIRLKWARQGCTMKLLSMQIYVMLLFRWTLPFFFLVAATCHAQGSREPVPSYDIRGGVHRLVSISNLFGNIPIGCSKQDRPLVGEVIKRQFDSDEMTIVGFVLRTNNDERFFINVDTDSLDELNRSMPNAGRTWIGELLKQGNKVRVTTIVCGSGSLEFADSVRLPD